MLIRESTQNNKVITISVIRFLSLKKYEFVLYTQQTTKHFSNSTLFT